MLPSTVVLDLPRGLARTLLALRQAGGRPYVVGGAVRDALLGLPVVDYDVEVFGLGLEELERVLAAHGAVDAVGEAFTVLKVSGLEGLPGAVDVSLPRRDSKSGPGHRGIAVVGDPGLPLAEAARRRDFTVNALLYDPFCGEVADPFGGRDDLRAGVLRAVDAGTFGDDPLRALRAVQLAARFSLSVEPATAALCAAMPLGELPAERIFGEMEKLLLKAQRPSLGLRLLRDWGLLRSVAPEALPLEETPQEPDWHPEGDVWTHTLLAQDEAGRMLAAYGEPGVGPAGPAPHDDRPHPPPPLPPGGRPLDRPRALALALATFCHDLGKPATTVVEGGRIRSPGHEEAGLPPTASLLDRWNVHTLLGYDLRGQVLALVGNHLKPGQLYDERERVGDGAVRRLARRCEPWLLSLVARADCLGRTGAFAPVAMDWFLARAHALDVAERPVPPLLLGRDLLPLGVAPGPRVGELLRAVYERQLDGAVSSREEALDEARRLLAAGTRG